MDSIKKRLVSQYLAVILLTIIVLEGLFIFIMTNYYYGGIEQALTNKAIVSSSFINRYAPSFSLNNKARYIFENIDKNELALVEVVNPLGHVVLDNSGFYPDKLVNTPELNTALKGNMGKWQGTSELGERIIVVATPLWQDGEVIGVLRYTSSLTEVDKVVVNILLFVLLIGAGVFLIALFVSSWLSRSIVKPIQDLTIVAEQMALGNFTVETPSLRYNDEIKKLADTLNYMATEITKTDKMKNDFISSISHELRTPLTSIKGWSETILAGDIDNKEESREGLNIIIRETDRLTSLVEELLDFSKYQSTTIILERENININEVIKRAKEQLKIKANHKNITLSIENKADSTWVYLDYNRIMQVMLNIIDNAIKFTPEGGLINIILTNKDNFVEIIVLDTGIGIEEKHLDKIKFKFYKTNPNVAGSGLGLAIADEIINLHGGSLSIHSIVNKGTKVTILLPIK